MTSISYSDIFSSFYVKLEAYDLFEPEMSDEIRNELLCQYLHSAIADTYVRRLFSTLTYTDPHPKGEEDKDDEDTTATDDTTISSDVTNSGDTTPTVDSDETINNTEDNSGGTTTPSESEATEESNVEEIVDGTIEFELKKPSMDDNADRDFIIEVLAYGMLYQWCLKFVYSATQLSQIIGTSQEKFYSQSSHTETNRNIQQDIRNFQRALIRDRGYVNNDWLDGTIKARKESSTTATS